MHIGQKLGIHFPIKLLFFCFIIEIRKQAINDAFEHPDFTFRIPNEWNFKEFKWNVMVWNFT